MATVFIIKYELIVSIFIWLWTFSELIVFKAIATYFSTLHDTFGSENKKHMSKPDKYYWCRKNATIAACTTNLSKCMLENMMTVVLVSLNHLKEQIPQTNSRDKFEQ